MLDNVTEFVKANRIRWNSKKIWQVAGEIERMSPDSSGFATLSRGRLIAVKDCWGEVSLVLV